MVEQSLRNGYILKIHACRCYVIFMCSLPFCNYSLLEADNNTAMLMVNLQEKSEHIPRVYCYVSATVGHCILVMTHHSYNDDEICFSTETDLGVVMERNMEVETLGGLICKLYI